MTVPSVPSLPDPGFVSEPTREQLAAQLAEARAGLDRAKAESRALLDFMGRFARDLLLPLNTIGGNARILRETRLEPLQAQTLRRVVEASDEITRPLKDLYRYAALEAGTFKAWPAQFALADLVRTLTEPLAAHARLRGQEISVELAPEVPRGISADPVALSEVISHLLDHALRATPRGSVDVQFAVRDSDGDDVCLYGTVRDGGPALTETQSRDLFRPFSPTWQPAPGETPRTGLGLALAARMIEALDGALWHEAHAGGGNTFHFALWVERADPTHTDPFARRQAT